MKVIWNSSNKGSNAQIDDDGLTVTVSPSTSDNMAITNVTKSSGVHYCEIEVVYNRTSIIGIYREPVNVTGRYSQANNWGYYGYSPTIYHNESYRSYGTGYGDGDTIGILLDLDNMKVGFYKNGVYEGDAYTDLPKGNYGIMVTNAATTYGIKYKGKFNKDDFKYPVPENTTPFEIFSSYLIESDSKIYSLQDRFYDIINDKYITCNKDFINDGFDNVSNLTNLKLSNNNLGVVGETLTDNKKVCKFSLSPNIKSIEYKGNESNYYILHNTDGYYSIVNDIITKTDIVELSSTNIVDKGFDDLSKLNNKDLSGFELIAYNANEIDIELVFILKTSFRPIDKFVNKIQLLKYTE